MPIRGHGPTMIVRHALSGCGRQVRQGAVTRITDVPAADVLPVFSPDGNRLMWTSTRTADGTSQLFIADLKLPE